NRDTAAMIANDIAKMVDSAKFSVQRPRALQALQIVEDKYKEKQAYVTSLVDSLQKIGALGVYNYEDQAASITEAYAIALAKGKPAEIKEIERQRDMLGKYGPVQKSLATRIEFENEELTRLQSKYDQARVDAENSLPATFIINHAYPAEKKAYPIRWLIVVIAMASTFALSIIAFAILDSYRQYRRTKRIVVPAAKGKELVDA
ncbi:MAG: hypothetical protein M3Q97_11720, partial [Bacteroidota bacterium]|nr:hypothetical protein [Bacteroidota bacterium]